MQFIISDILAKLAPKKDVNLGILLKFLVFLVILVCLYSAIFHFLMIFEGRQYSWITGLYWTLTVMSTLGFGDRVDNTGFSCCMPRQEVPAAPIPAPGLRAARSKRYYDPASRNCQAGRRAVDSGGVFSRMLRFRKVGASIALCSASRLDLPPLPG